jgi:hypothetical protein
MKNSKGYTLAIAVCMMALLIGLGLGALNYSGRQGQVLVNQTLSTQAFWLADAGIQTGMAQLKNQINNILLNNISNSVKNGVVPVSGISTVPDDLNAYFSNQNPLGLLTDYGGFSGNVNGTPATLLVTPSAPFNLGGLPGTYNATITVTAGSNTSGNSGNPEGLTINSYIFYYKYFITSTGTVTIGTTIKKQIPRTIILGTGTFTVTVGPGNAAKYALLFLDSNLSGPQGYFTSLFVENGPIFTNSYFAFLGDPNPAGTFNASVGQVSPTALFYNNGSLQSLNSNQNPAGAPAVLPTSWNGTTNYSVNTYVTYSNNVYLAIQNSINSEPDTQTAYWKQVPSDIPVFNAGFTRGASPITLLPSGTTQTSLENEALGQASGTSPSPPSNNGIYVPNSSGSVIGGIFVEGDAAVLLGTDANNNPCYTATQTCYTITVYVPGTQQVVTTQTVTVNYSMNQTTLSGAGGGTYTGIPHGVDQNVAEGYATLIYVTGQITGIAGIVQENTILTISAVNDVVITDDPALNSQYPGLGIQYQLDPTLPGNQGALNLLGLISWTGNIRIGVSAPLNIVVQGVMLAPGPAPGGHALQADNTGGPQGTIKLLGGIISSFPGITGTDNNGNTTGYSEIDTYDTRLKTGITPIYFPYTSAYSTIINQGSSGGVSNATFGPTPVFWNECLPNVTC